MEGAPPLLLLLDSLVVGDAQPPGFSGSVAVGVERAKDCCFWLADFGSSVVTRFCELRPVADVVVVVDEAEAAVIVAPSAGSAGTGAWPATARIDGDRALLAKWAKRYAAPRSWLDVRAAR